MANIKTFKNLQVSDNDLIGNKFNGYDLHLKLREHEIDSSMLVWNKDSDDQNTYVIAGEKQNRQLLRDFTQIVRKQYCLDKIYGLDAYEVLYSQLFLEADVVHFHLLHNMSFDFQILPIMSKLKPLVWTVHDPWVLSGHCIHHFECSRWETGCGDCPLLGVDYVMHQDNTALNWELKKQSIQNAKLNIIVASRWMEKKIRLSPLFKNANIFRIPFGIDQNIFKPSNQKTAREKLGIPANALVIVARCVYNKFKGFDVVEYVMDYIQSPKPVYLLLMDNMLHDKNKKYHVKEYGWVKDDRKIAEIFAAADLFLMPSRVETFGMMAIEAMSCGVLPIVFEGTALPEVINAPACGVAVETDREKYAETVQYFVDHQKERQEKALKCLEFARTNYASEQYIEKILNVYKEVMSRHKNGVAEEQLLMQLKKYMLVKAVNSIDKSKQEITYNNLKLKCYTLEGQYKELEENFYQIFKNREAFEIERISLIKRNQDLGDLHAGIIEEVEKIRKEAQEIRAKSTLTDMNNKEINKQYREMQKELQMLKNLKVIKLKNIINQFLNKVLPNK